MNSLDEAIFVVDEDPNELTAAPIAKRVSEKLEALGHKVSFVTFPRELSVHHRLLGLTTKKPFVQFPFRLNARFFPENQAFFDGLRAKNPDALIISYHNTLLKPGFLVRAFGFLHSLTGRATKLRSTALPTLLNFYLRQPVLVKPSEDEKQFDVEVPAIFKKVTEFERHRLSIERAIDEARGANRREREETRYLLNSYLHVADAAASEKHGFMSEEISDAITAGIHKKLEPRFSRRA